MPCGIEWTYFDTNCFCHHVAIIPYWREWSVFKIITTCLYIGCSLHFMYFPIGTSGLFSSLEFMGLIPRLGTHAGSALCRYIVDSPGFLVKAST